MSNVLLIVFFNRVYVTDPIHLFYRNTSVILLCKYPSRTDTDVLERYESLIVKL